MFGYFNEFTKKFNETEVLRRIYESGYNDDLNIVILDEMNIARVEYYFYSGNARSQRMENRTGAVVVGERSREAEKRKSRDSAERMVRGHDQQRRFHVLGIG